MSKFTLFFISLLFYSGGLFACVKSLIPPYPDLTKSYNWASDSKVIYGEVSDVEQHLNLTWVERKLIDWGILDYSVPPGGVTPLHSVTLDNVHYYVGRGVTPVLFKLSGCGIPIPKKGWHAIFFISGKGGSQTVVPLYETSGETYNKWMEILEKRKKLKKDQRLSQLEVNSP